MYIMVHKMNIEDSTKSQKTYFHCGPQETKTDTDSKQQGKNDYMYIYKNYGLDLIPYEQT